MDLTELRPVGREYLRLVTELLQQQRLADPFAGLFEAADLQWWYTRDPHSSDRDAAVWLVGDTPVAATVFTRWSESQYACSVLGDTSVEPAWAFLRARCAELRRVPVEMEVDPADPIAVAEAERAGFADTVETFELTWLEAADRVEQSSLPAGYSVIDRRAQRGQHPMAKRNGPEIEPRLRECSLYDPALDLAVVTADGDVAAYALFWGDLRTGVGMVEPMRVEAAHAGRGVGRALLDEGLARLADAGCRRLKVIHEVSNPASTRLYHGAGFVTRSRVPLLRRPAHATVTSA